MKVSNLFVYFLMLMSTACSKNVPVMVGGDKIYDACGTAAETIPSAIKKVKVYSAPDGESGVIDVISTRMYVAVCDFDGNGLSSDWVGIVYSKDGTLNCGVGATIEKRQPYNGTCKSGWVKRANLKNWIG